MVCFTACLANSKQQKQFQFSKSQLLFGLVNTRWHILYTHLTSMMDTGKQEAFLCIGFTLSPCTTVLLVYNLLETGKSDYQNAFKTQRSPRLKHCYFARAFSQGCAGQCQAAGITTSFRYLGSEQTSFLANL